MKLVGLDANYNIFHIYNGMDSLYIQYTNYQNKIYI